MAKRIAVANQKGGSGKSTTTANLASAFAEEGFKVLGLDLDAQSQLATLIGVPDDVDVETAPNITDILTLHGAKPLSEVIVPSAVENIDLVLGSFSVTTKATELTNDPVEGPYVLQNILNDEALRAQGLNYDVIVMDTAPRLDVVLDAALTAADATLPVLAPEGLAVDAIVRYLGWVKRIQKRMNPDLVTLPVLVNKANLRWASSAKAVADMEEMGIEVFPDVIPVYSRVVKMNETGPVLFAAPDSPEAGVVRAAMGAVIDRMFPAAVSA